MATLESDPMDIVENASNIEMEDLPAEEWINDQEMEQEAGPVVWKDKPIKRPGTKCASNDIYRAKEGVTSYSKNVQSPYEAFKLFFNEQMVHTILVHTNHRMTEEKLDQVNEIELDAFIGTLIAMGVSHQASVPVCEHWSQKSHSYIPIFAGTFHAIVLKKYSANYGLMTSTPEAKVKKRTNWLRSEKSLRYLEILASTVIQLVLMLQLMKG